MREYCINCIHMYVDDVSYFTYEILNTYLTIWWVDNLGEEPPELSHVSVVWRKLIHIETLGMKRCDRVNGTIVL